MDMTRGDEDKVMVPVTGESMFAEDEVVNSRAPAQPPREATLRWARGVGAGRGGLDGSGGAGGVIDDGGNDVKQDAEFQVEVGAGPEVKQDTDHQKSNEKYEVPGMPAGEDVKKQGDEQKANVKGKGEQLTDSGAPADKLDEEAPEFDEEQM